MAAPRRILLATPRAITAARLTRALNALPAHQVIGSVADLSSAYISCESAEPDLVLLGPELIRQAEFEGLLSLFRVTGTAWLKIATDHDAAGQSEAALHSGDPPERLLQALAGAHRPKVIARRGAIVAQAAAIPPAAAGMAPPAGAESWDDKLVLLGASTGGIDALMTLLSHCPPDCPPMLIVQHTGAGFSDSLIRLFARACPARVVAASDAAPLTRGTIMVAAGCAGHLRLGPHRPWTSQLQQGAAISGHVPSVDALFRSAVPFAPQVVAALLTGMGRDGAQGLLELRRAGAATIAQDQASAVVYGMPRAAAELGAAQMILPLDRIAPEILDLCRTRPASLLAR